MTKMETCRLVGRQLNFAVALATGTAVKSAPDGTLFLGNPQLGITREFCPAQAWEQGGPLLEAARICVMHNPSLLYDEDARWKAAIGPDVNSPTFCQYGPTPLLAAMRCLVQMMLGDIVELPEA